MAYKKLIFLILSIIFQQSSSLNILFITPTKLPTVTGNSIDIHRLTTGLEQLGHQTLVFTPDAINIETILEFKPDIIHAFHGFKSRRAVAIAHHLHIPYVLTLSGTDYNQCLLDPAKAAQTEDTILKASHLITFNNTGLNNTGMNALIKKHPELKEQCSIIRRGEPHCDANHYDFRERFNFNEDDFIYLHVAGIRPVKNNLMPIHLLEKLHEQHPNVKLAFVGSILDQEYFTQFQDAIKDKDWIRYLGPLPHDDIWQAYKGCNVAINCSQSEAESLAVIEAMYMQKPIIASAIPSNTIFIKEGRTGLQCFLSVPIDLYNAARTFYNDPRYRAALAQGAHDFIMDYFNTDEIKEYETVYMTALKQS
ncbi:glycosyltransferase family 4 protein [bacterium]|jgi:glycosyltransferase involved in cell wall biosynthesis|nr:glycosyltransferase family 4 protein [bacterium]MBT5015733.1 glycosyltransferase family 4 protein [bacterium]